MIKPEVYPSTVTLDHNQDEEGQGRADDEPSARNFLRKGGEREGEKAETIDCGAIIEDRCYWPGHNTTQSRGERER